MKKLITLFLLSSLLGLNSAVFGNDENTTLKENLIEHNDAPIWADYVAPKYRNPRADFTKGSAITELAIGAVLTELIITSPIGIPMAVHGTTKVKMISYNNRKNIFDTEIEKAKLIQDDKERAERYEEILKQCHLKESTKEHYAKKEAKAQAKAAKKGNSLK